ncbi:MAG: DNA cytosine methyltransferase [Chloroflexota bacterium]
MKLLDLYCGVGLASWGYWQSGRFSEIVGVDSENEHRRSYSFDFIHADALSLDYEFLSQFDFIHASPPCQAYSKATPREKRHHHERLIQRTHVVLHAIGKPYVVENVEGSGASLKPSVRLRGVDVGLPHDRPRYFHISTWPGANLRKFHVANLRMSSAANFKVRPVHDGKHKTKSELVELFGLQEINQRSLARMSIDAISQGIPPAMTKAIACAIIPEPVWIN